MTLETLLVLAAGAFIAFVNGANDVSKGIATLAGSGVTDQPRAVLWGSTWTAIGGLAATTTTGAMVATFGHGMLSTGTSPTFVGGFAILLGAGGWVLVATRTGLPVSTTHALVGSLVGVASVAYGPEAVLWSALGGKVALPLLLSPVVSLGLTAVALRAHRAFASKRGIQADCLCAELEPDVVLTRSGAAGAITAALAARPSLSIAVDSAKTCAVDRPRALRLTLNQFHWLTSGAASLARGLNDAPKIAALVLAASAMSAGGSLRHQTVFALVTTAMVAGSVVAGFRVTQVLACKVTSMNHREGFWANAVTAALVGAGAVGGLPMSTTHVSASAIVATCTEKGPGAVNRRTVRDMLLAWAVTVPGAAVLSVASYAGATLLWK